MNISFRLSRGDTQTSSINSGAKKLSEHICYLFIASAQQISSFYFPLKARLQVKSTALTSLFEGTLVYWDLCGDSALTYYPLPFFLGGGGVNLTFDNLLFKGTVINYPIC